MSASPSRPAWVAVSTASGRRTIRRRCAMQPDVGRRAGWARVWPALLAVGTVGAVGGPAAVASYRHARDVIAAHGDPVMAPFLPLSVDGMLVAALVVIWVRRHRGDRAGVFPWCAFGFGMVVTVLANLAAVRVPSPVAVAVALFPPLALAVTLELVALIAYRSGPRALQPAAEPLLVTRSDDGDTSRQPWSDTPSLEDSNGQKVAALSGAHAAGDHVDTGPRREVDARVPELTGLLAAGQSLTGAEVAERFGCSPRTGRRLLTRAQQATAESRDDATTPGPAASGSRRAPAKAVA